MGFSSSNDEFNALLPRKSFEYVRVEVMYKDNAVRFASPFVIDHYEQELSYQRMLVLFVSTHTWN